MADPAPSVAAQLLAAGDAQAAAARDPSRPWEERSARFDAASALYRSALVEACKPDAMTKTADEVEAMEREQGPMAVARFFRDGGRQVAG